MTDSWVDCTVCGNRYGSFMPGCPRCAAPNPFASQPAAKKGAGGKIALGAGIAIAVIAAAIILVPAAGGIITSFLVSQEGSNPIITILQQQSQEPTFVAREELVQHALDLINSDRADFGLPPVELSPNQAAQVHAEDVYGTKQISHWMTNGEKPYMTYSKYGGEGSVQQNVAIAGFPPEQYEQCVSNILYDCEKIEPVDTITELQYEMMYNDKECCNDGHRNNILNKYHTHVSIGIVYDEYYLAIVQNFENNYGLDISVSGGQVRISGDLVEGELDHVGIYYDEMPAPETYEENKRLLSYSGGEIVATVVKPLPPGYYYQEADGYELVVANRWAGEGDSVDVRFNLAPIAERDGVYTLSAFVKDGDDIYEVTSYSIFLKSEENSTEG